jgi:hypothetical protein
MFGSVLNMQGHVGHSWQKSKSEPFCLAHLMFDKSFIPSPTIL